MYELNKHLNLKEMCEFLGLGRNRTLRLCQERTHGFPAVKVGNKYVADRTKLQSWYDDWYAGKFCIDD